MRTAHSGVFLRRLISRFAFAITCAALQACGGGSGSDSASAKVTDATAASRTLSELASQPGIFFIAGSIGGPGYLDGQGQRARLDHPQGIAASMDGTLYIADTGNQVIRRIAADGTVSTFAGKRGASGTADGSLSDARFSILRHIAIDAAGNLYATDGNSIRKVAVDGQVTTVAGAAAVAGSADGFGTAARFANPVGIAVDGTGTVFVADQDNHTIRRISASGQVTTLAGQAGISGGDDGTGAAARFNKPQGIALDSSGALYVADRDNYTIRKVMADGTVSTVAGSNRINGSTDGTGAAAQFFAPQSIAADASGNLFVADAFPFPRMCLCGANGLIRRIAPDGSVTTLAGTSKAFGSADGVGPAARFDLPLGIAAAPDGALYVSDTGNSTIRRVAYDGTVTTFAGEAGVAGQIDGDGAAARFHDAVGIASDALGNLYVADTSNTPDESNAVIRKWAAGTVSTMAGIPGVTGTGYADGAPASARFDFPRGVVATGGNLYVADTANGVIRKISPTGTVSTLAGTARSFGSVDGIGAAARFQGPAAIAADTQGNLYVADLFLDTAGNDGATIRKVTSSGVVTTIAGTAGIGGDADGMGANARFARPLGIAVDAHGNIHVTDAARHTVRRISPAGMVVTLAGLSGATGSTDATGASARFHGPQGIALDAQGNAFIADTLNNLVRKVAPDGTVTTIAGTAGLQGNLPGPLSGTLYRPQGIAVAQEGILVIASPTALLGLKLP